MIYCFKKSTIWILTLLIVLVLLSAVQLQTASAATSTWDGSIDTTFAGEGTEASPYQITSAAELAGFSSLSQSNNFINKYFVMTVDVDLNNRQWTPVGNFLGSFDGQGHIISNLAIGTSGSYNSSYSKVGMFTRIYNATIKNLGLEDISMYVSSAMVGGLVGEISYGCTISNCFVSGTIVNNYPTTYNYVGGLGGYASGSDLGGKLAATNCGCTVNVTSYDGDGRNYPITGGLFGYAMGTITNCYTAGSVYIGESSFAATVIGYARDAVLTNVYVNSSLSGTPIAYSSNVTGSVTSQSSSVMRSASFVTLLNSNVPGSSWAIVSGTNNSYPIPSSAAVLSLNPSTDKTFTAQPEGYAAQTAHTVTVNNTGGAGTGEITVALSGTNAASFSLSETSLSSIAAGGSDSFTVVPNTGLTLGTYNATVTVSASGLDSRSFDVSFTVFTPTYTIAADPASLAFGELPEGYTTPAAKTVEIENTGNSTVTVTLPTHANYAITTSDSLTLVSGATATVSITPKAGRSIGTYDATLTFTTDHSTSTDVAVTFAVAAPSYTIEASKASMDFGSVVEIYTQPAAQTVVIENTGNSSATVTLPTNANYSITTADSLTLAPGSTATVSIQPKGDLNAGVYDATLTFTTDHATSDSVDVKFTVIAAVYQISVSPTAQNFGNQTIGYAPVAAVTITITNTGTKPVTLNQPAAVDFTVGSLSQTTINPTAIATFTVKPADGLLVGAYTETIPVTGSDGAAASITVSFVVDPVYYGIDGDDLYCRNSAKGLELTSDGKFTDFTGVTVDGVTVAPGNYTAREGSTIVTLYTEYLDTLAAGEHTFRMVFSDGYAQMAFSVINPEMPDTGDDSPIALYLLFSVAALAAAFLLLRKYGIVR